MTHQIINKIKIPILLITVSCLIAYYLVWHPFVVGEVVDKYLPCLNNSKSGEMTIPCYGKYDIGIFILLIGISLSSLLLILIRLVNYS